MSRNQNRMVAPLHSSKVNAVPTELKDGEIAINNAAGRETMYVKNSANKIVELGPAHYTILTQAEYDAIPSSQKDPSHIYYIK